MGESRTLQQSLGHAYPGEDMNDRLEEYRKIVHATVKDITHIGTEIAPCSLFIDIRIVFGDQHKVVSIPISDIETNLHDSKGFLELITGPLEEILTPR